MNNPRMRTKRGTLTKYAFACGYIEEKGTADNRAALSLDGCWHVKGFKQGAHFWECFDNARDARKFFNNVLKG